MGFFLGHHRATREDCAIGIWEITAHSRVVSIESQIKIASRSKRIYSIQLMRYYEGGNGEGFPSNLCESVLWCGAFWSQRREKFPMYTGVFTSIPEWIEVENRFKRHPFDWASQRERVIFISTENQLKYSRWISVPTVAIVTCLI